ncbi:MAG: hypothetical protein KIT41_12675 [Pyrinomonadaceae bacterium]|nr:hypothetical protein [Pyrinomonadaceae bacterium]
MMSAPNKLSPKSVKVQDMFCPRCSTRYDDQVQYCRACGLALDEVTKIVSGDGTEAGKVVSKPNYTLMRFGFALFILGVSIALLNAAVKDLDLVPEIYGKVTFMLMVSAGLLLMGSSFLFPTRTFRPAKGRTGPARPVSAPATGPMGELPDGARSLNDLATSGLNDSVPSVVENTTRKLK